MKEERSWAAEFTIGIYLKWFNYVNLLMYKGEKEDSMKKASNCNSFKHMLKANDNKPKPPRGKVNES